MRTCCERKGSFVPGVANRPVGSRGCGYLAGVDHQEAAILARREELIIAGRFDPQRSGVEAQEWLGSGHERVEPVEDVRDVEAADRFRRIERLADRLGLPEVAALPSVSFQHQASGRGPRRRLRWGLLVAVIDRVTFFARRGLEGKAAKIARTGLEDAPGDQLVASVEDREVLPSRLELTVCEELGEHHGRLGRTRRNANVAVITEGGCRGCVRGLRFQIVRRWVGRHGGRQQGGRDGSERPPTNHGTARRVVLRSS